MTFDLQNPNPNAGDSLRDQAGNLLSVRYGQVLREKRSRGKKVDLYVEYDDFGKTTRIYIEAKDYSSPLTRSQVVTIWADYSGIVKQAQPASLLLVTRAGLTPDAQSFISDEVSDMRHRTIWDLENDILGITEYVRHLENIFDEDGLSSYYVPCRSRSVSYGKDNTRTLSEVTFDLFTTIQEWILSEDESPLAILGGYGEGKTSLSKRLVSSQAKSALSDPSARRPIIIKLGSLTQFSSLEGLLGGLFTSEFPTQGFNFRNFMALNERGRLLIVLDGFDEMKHAMTWADFRAQVSELARLMAGKAKIILLGRPSAFLSSEEHIQVLRGAKKRGDVWTKIPSWPSFNEFEIEQFDREERSAFISKYLARSGHLALDCDWIKQRTSEVNEIADSQPEIFAKPVHSKIFTDLAADKDIDLSVFKDRVTTWGLYEIFFSTLSEREDEKSARRPISASTRIVFLESVAYWLWTSKGASTSFSAHEVPSQLFEALPDGESLEEEGKIREYLTGSILEKKSGDTFYFGHRSFAEYLVARHLSKRTPSGRDH